MGLSKDLNWLKEKMIKNILRIIIGLVAFFIGILHFVRNSEMAVYVPFPFGAVPFVYLIGVIIVFASFNIIVNNYVIPSLVTLALTLSFTALLVQIPVLLREREYILKVIGLSNLIKLFLAIFLLLMALYYKKLFTRSGNNNYDS